MYTRSRCRCVVAARPGRRSAATESVAQVVRVSVATDGTASEQQQLHCRRCRRRAGSSRSRRSPRTWCPATPTASQDVFLRDRDTDADGVFDEAGAVSTVRVSQRGGVQANGASNEPAITPDGRYVVFSSFACQPVLGRPAAAAVVGDPALGSAHAATSCWSARRRRASRCWRPRRSIPTSSDDGNQVVFVLRRQPASRARRRLRRHRLPPRHRRRHPDPGQQTR